MLAWMSVLFKCKYVLRQRTENLDYNCKNQAIAITSIRADISFTFPITIICITFNWKIVASEQATFLDNSSDIY